MKLSSDIQDYIDFVKSSPFHRLISYNNGCNYVINHTIAVLKNCNDDTNYTRFFNIFYGSTFNFQNTYVSDILGVPRYYSDNNGDFSIYKYTRGEFSKKFFGDYFCKKYIFFCLFSTALKTMTKEPFVDYLKQL